MLPSGFVQANTVINPPEGVSAAVIEPVAAWVGMVPFQQVPGEVASIITCWQVTKEELLEIQRTGRVWVTIAGRMPPIQVSGTTPFEVDPR